MSITYSPFPRKIATLSILSTEQPGYPGAGRDPAPATARKKLPA
jgi:hypothetical protein